MPKSNRPELSGRFGWPLATPQIMATGIHCPCTLAVNLPFVYLLSGAFPVAVSTFLASDLHSYSYTLCAYGAVILERHMQLLQCAVRGTYTESSTTLYTIV